MLLLHLFLYSPSELSEWLIPLTVWLSCVEMFYQILVHTYWTGYRRHCTLKSHSLIGISLVLAQLQIKRAHSFGIYYIGIIFYTNCSTVFRAYSAANFLAYLENWAHMIISILTAFTQVINKRLSSTTGDSINRH